MAKSPYQLWKEQQEKEAKGQSTVPRAPYRAVQYANPTYKGKSEDKSYKWETENLKPMRSSKNARSYNDKFSNWAKNNGLSNTEAREFRTWLDSKEDGVKTNVDFMSETLTSLRKRNELQAERMKNTPKQTEEPKTQVPKPKNSLLKDIGAGFKGAFQAVNPFDDVSMSDALMNFANRDKSKGFQELQRGSNRTVDSASLGALSAVDRKMTGGTPYYMTQRKIGQGGGTDMLTSGLGYLIPGVGAYKALGATRAGKGLEALAQQGVKQRVASEAAKGAITGAGVAGAEIGIREGITPEAYNANDNLKHLALGTGAGAVADPLLYGAGQVVLRGMSRFAKGDVPTFTGKPSEQTVNSLIPQPPVKSPVETNFDSLIPRRTVAGEVLPEQQPYFRAKSELEQIRPQAEGLNREFEQAVEEQYRYLKNSMGKGVQQGGVVKDSEGYVTGAYGRISNNPKWYQDFYAANGRKPTNEELRDLAEIHVREGFEDEVGALPAWQPSSVQEIDDQIEQLSNLLRQDPSQEQAITPILGALEQDKAEILRSIESTQKKATTLQQQVEQLKPTRETTAPLQKGRDYEPIESIGIADDGGKLVRVKENPLDQTTGNADTFRTKINRTPKKEKTNVLAKLRTQFVDDGAPIEILEKKLSGGKLESAENSIYKQFRLAKGSPAKAEQIVKEQLYPIVNDIQKKKIYIEDLGDYALAVHAKDVNAKGINSGFTNAEIDSVINKFKSDDMEAARKKLLDVNNHVLDMLSSSGVLSKEQVDAMREKYPNYMSLFRAFDDDKIDFSSGLSKALSVASSPIKKLEGSSRDVIDPIESMIKNIYKATSVADRNNAASKLANIASKDVEGNFVRKLDDGEDAGRLNVISTLNNGKKERYEVPPEVYKALKDLDKESTNTLIEILQKPASMLRAGATLTPEFSLRNPLRDVPNAFVVSESGFNPITDFTFGLVQAIGKGRTVKIGKKEFKVPGEVYKQFIKENGGYGNIISMDRQMHRETLKKALTESSTHYVDVLNPKTYTALIKKFANPLNTLRSIADISETATKVGEYRAALRKGATPQEAAYRARDIMDFGRAGISIREANKVVAFLNANIQGKSKLWRSFKSNPARFIGKSAAIVTIPTIGAIVAQHTYSNEKQRELLDDAPQWLKDTFYLIPIPGTDQIARIPKPFDLSFAFSNTIERAADFIYKNDNEAFDGWIKQAFSQAAVPTMLTGIAPIIEGMANYSFFRQGPIIPMREEGIVDYPDQHDVNTTETAKFIGKQIDKVTGGTGAFRNFGSPRIIDNTIQGFAGGLGTYTTSAIDVIVDGLTDSQEPEKPKKNIDQQPLARAFLMNQSSSGQSLEDFYNLKEQLTTSRGSAKQNEKTFQDERAYKQANKVGKTLSDINKEIRSVENHPTMSGEQKRKKLDELIQERNEIARKAMEQLRGKR